MTSLPNESSLVMRMVGAFLVLVAIGGLMYGITTAADEYQQAKDDAVYYKSSTAELMATQKALRKQVAELKAQQDALVKFFEDEGEVVPSDLGGSGPPATVLREFRSSQSSGGTTSRRIVRHHSSVSPSQPSSSTPSQHNSSDAPSVKVPDLPAVPKVDVPKVDLPPMVEDTKDNLLNATPLDGVL